MSEEVRELVLNETKEPVSDTRKYLIFSSDGRLFGVDTDYVETILDRKSVV